MGVTFLIGITPFNYKDYQRDSHLIFNFLSLIGFTVYYFQIAVKRTVTRPLYKQIITMNKTIFITGASTGFGRVAADLLHKKGYTVFGTSRSPSKHNTDFELIEMDLTNGDSIKTAVAYVKQKSDRIDVLINNAGRAMFGPMEEASEQNTRELFETNVFGLINVTNAVLPSMRQQKSGRIINVSSLAGIAPVPTIGIYSASKHAVEGYSKCLMLEVEQFGIDVALVKPGEYLTEVFANSIQQDLSINDYQGFNDLIAKLEQQRKPEEMLKPDEVSQLIVDLVEAESVTLDHLIGPFADVIPELSKTPQQLYATSKELYQLDTLL